MLTARCNNFFDLIPGQLKFSCFSESPPPRSSDYEYINSSDYNYTAFFADFGPLHLGLTYQFARNLNTLLEKAQSNNKIVVYECSSSPHQRANGILLICAYLICVKNLSSEEAFKPFIGRVHLIYRIT